MSKNQELVHLAQRVDAQLKRDDMYRKEKMEAFGVSWQEWLSNEIRNALNALNVWVDDNIVESVRRFLIERGFIR